MNNTLTLGREITFSKHINAVIGVVFFILATAFGAYIRIPLPGTPVPMTLQTFFVALSGAILGRKLGSISQVSYIILGAFGLPIFQGYGFGVVHLLGPTGGYLIGFVAASYITGRLLEKTASNPYKIVAAFIAGTAVLYAFGIAWLITIYRMSFLNAVAIGFIPFLTAEAAKIFAATLIYRTIADRSKNIFS
jgi:biotin transport system substrate-specific component